MERLLEDWQHQYRATPSEYPISNNNRPATHDQFITLRDTFVMSNKYYADKAGRSIIVWTKLDWTPTDTIEIREPNISKLAFEPWYTADSWLDDSESQWEYVTTGASQTSNPIACTINKKWRYRISHKEQFINLDTAWISRVHTLAVQHQASGSTISRAVFDWERANAWDVIRVTAYGYVECDLEKWDWLELKMLDQNDNDISSSYLQTYSNWRSVEYVDLAYKL